MTSHDPATEGRNRLLTRLGRDDRERLLSQCDPVGLEYKLTLYRAYEPIQFVYFIESGVASLVNTMEDGASAEVGTIGNEGLVGLPVILADDQAPTSVYIQVPGAGLRMKAEIFRQEMERSRPLRTLMLHYAHAFFNQVAQSGACAHFHNIEQRCSRWLLMTRDRMPNDEFPLTQEFLSMMLGVRRAGVTEAIGALQREGLIRHRYGHITVLDRPGLERRACECYFVSRTQFDRLLGAEVA